MVNQREAQLFELIAGKEQGQSVCMHLLDFFMKFIREAVIKFG